MADGKLYANDPLGDEPQLQLKVGGLVRHLVLDQARRRLYTAGLCGVLSIDLEAWLGH
jgi:hypothetical protein